jgi:outer membrane immunogenic protein
MLVIKKLLLSTAALTVLAGTALAADLPSRRAPPVYIPPPAIPVFTWTGLYVGVHAGYEFGRSNAFASNPALGGLAANGSSPSGIIGGGHVGYNFSTQGLPLFGGFTGAGGVIGVEGDVDGSNYRSTYALGGINDATRQNIQGSVRGRLGVAVDRALFYATGGVAFGGLSNTYTNAFNGSTDSLSHTRVGYTVGGGVEYAITNNVSLRAEYRYTDFGTFSDNLGNTTNGGVNVRHKETDNRVLGGISYKFDTFSPLAPVIARY